MAVSPSLHPCATPPDRRWRQIGTGAGALVTGRLITAVCGLVQLPVVLHSLGEVAFGLWLTLGGLLWTLSILDGGLGYAMQNRITRLVANNGRPEAAALARRALVYLGRGAVLLLVVLGPVIVWGHWPAWFSLADSPLRNEIAPAVAIVLVAAAINLPFSLATRVATALQETWMVGVGTGVASLLGLGAVVAAARLNFGLPGFMLAACVLPVAPHLIAWILLRRRHAWLFQRYPGAAPAAPGIGRESSLFFLPQLGATFIGSFVPVLVAVFAGGPAVVAVFGVLQRVYGLALQVHSMTLAPAWPAYAQAAATGDAAFARRTFRVSWMITAGVFILPTLLLTPWVPSFVHLWLGPQAPEINPFLLWALAGWSVCQYSGQTIVTLLNGTGQIRSLTALVWVGIALNLGLCVLLGPLWGAVGIVVALAVPYLLLNLPVTSWQAHRILRELSSIRRRAGEEPAS